MIYAAVKPIEKYSVIHEGYSFGLYDTYVDDPTLLALIMIGTPLAYDYETGRSAANVRVQINKDGIKHFKPTLESVVDGATIEELLKTLNPVEFYDRIKDKPISLLPIVKHVTRTESIFLTTVAARAAAWALSYRGEVETKGNVIRVNFGGKKACLATKKMIECHKAMEAVMRGLNDK